MSAIQKTCMCRLGLWHHLIWLQPAQYIVDPATRVIVLRLQYLHDGNTKTDTLEVNQGRCWCKQNRAKEEMKPHSNHDLICLSHNYPLLQFHEQPYHQGQKETIILNLTSNLHIFQRDPLDRSMVWKLRQAEHAPQIPQK